MSNSKKFLFCIISIFLLFLPLYYPVQYNTVDDFGFAAKLSGALTDSPCAVTIYEGYLWGVLLAFLYEYLPIIEWYTLLFHLLVTTSGLILIRECICLKMNIISKTVSLFALLSCVIYTIVCLQFTIVSSMLALASVLLLYKHSNYFYIIIALILVLFSLEIRLDATILIYGLAFPILVFPIIQKKTSYKKLLYSLIGIGVIIGCVIITNNIPYQTKAEKDQWEEFHTYNKVRGYINDHPLKPMAIKLFEDDKAKYVQYKILCNYGSLDYHILNQKDLDSCAGYLKSNYHHSIIGSIKPYLNGYKTLGGLFVLFLIVAIVFYTFRRKQRNGLILISATLLMLLLEHVYLLTTSIFKERVCLCIILCTLLLFVIIAYRILSHKHFSVIMLIVSFGVLSIYIPKIRAWYYTSLYYDSIINERMEILKNTNSRYVLMGPQVLYYFQPYHISDLENERIVKLRWLGIGINSYGLDGYSKIVEKKIPVLVSKNALNYINDIQELLKVFYKIDTNSVILAESEHYCLVKLECY